MINKVHTISISNHKGGVGKTTSSINLGMGLKLLKKKVLLIDLDPQANLSQSLHVLEEKKNIYGVLRGDYKIEPKKVIEGLDVVPSHLDLSGAEIELGGEAGREYILSEVIDSIKMQYDYILIDCPPSLGLLTLNAFVASDEIFIPVQAEYLALQGLAKMVEIIEKVKKRLNKTLQLGGIIITQYDHRKVLNKDIVKALEDRFKDKVFTTKIRDNIALAEAPTEGVDIFRYNEKSYGAIDYLDLAKEMLKIKK